MKAFVWAFLTIGGLLGSWIGSLFDHGHLLGAWGIILGAVGSILGIWAGVKLGDYI